MSSITGTYKKVTDGSAEYVEPLLDELLGKVLFCRKDNGRGFSARLVGVDGYKLIFQNSRGDVMLNDFRRLVYISDQPWTRQEAV